jgi:hypothetical protein
MTASYSHTQQGRTVLLIAGTVMIGVFVLVIGMLATTSPPPPPYVLLVIIASMGIAVASMWIFSTLHVEVDSNALRWYFGRGVPKFSIPLHEIQSAKVVKNSWIYGLGIHFTPSGWLYNVSGLRAVEVTRLDGKRVRIGTDEPEALLAAITSARGHSFG